MIDRRIVKLSVTLADWRKHGAMLDLAGALARSAGGRGVDSTEGIEPDTTCGVVSLTIDEANNSAFDDRSTWASLFPFYGRHELRRAYPTSVLFVADGAGTMVECEALCGEPVAQVGPDGACHPVWLARVLAYWAMYRATFERMHGHAGSVTCEQAERERIGGVA